MTKNLTIPERLEALRSRAGLSIAQLARGMGYKTASGVQRYLDPELFVREYLPREIAERAADALTGKGSPAITHAEVMALAGIVAPASNSAVVGGSGARQDDFTTIIDGREAMPTREAIDMLVDMIGQLPEEAASEVIRRAYANMLTGGKNKPRPRNQAETS